MNSSSALKAKDLGIDLDSHKEAELFKWLLFSVLITRTNQHGSAARAHRAIVGADITNIAKLIRQDISELVSLLDKMHYSNDGSAVAARLVHVFSQIKEKYGSISELIKQSDTARDLENRLLAIKGVSPIAAKVFVHDIAPHCYPNTERHDYLLALQAIAQLQDSGYEAYIVGGSVRDIWLGHEPKDFDIVTSARPKQIMSVPGFKLAKQVKPAQAYGVTLAHFNHEGERALLEIVTYRQDIDAHKGRRATRTKFASLAEDLQRRDLTINALAMDPMTNFVVDFTGGINDLDNKIIRFIGEPLKRIQEDPLRVIRAIRLKNQLAFSYAPTTYQALIDATRMNIIETIPTDRLRNELTKMLVHPSRKHSIIDLANIGILERILPEVVAGKNIPQPVEFHAEGTVWEHELLILDCLPQNPSARLVWAALLHDIGKGPTMIKPHAPHEHIHYHRHYAVGAEMAHTILKRFKFSNRAIRDITWMIYNHLSIDDLPSMRRSRQYEMLSNPAFEDLLQLHKADAMASWRPGSSHGKEPAFRSIEKLWHAYQTAPIERRTPSLKRDIGIDGNWLIKYFNNEFELKGKEIGYVLRQLEEWYRDTGTKNKAAFAIKARHLILKYRNLTTRRAKNNSLYV